MDLDAARLPDGRFSLVREDGRQVCGRGRGHGPGGVEVVRGWRAVMIPIAATRRGRSGLLPEAAVKGIEEIRALMHGRIVEVRVSAGDRVDQGALLLVLEAMKMQNEIRATRPGVVESAGVAAGDTVEAGAALVSIRSDKI